MHHVPFLPEVRRRGPAEGPSLCASGMNSSGWRLTFRCAVAQLDVVGAAVGQDGRGNKIRVCKICLQKVLQRRLNVAGGAPLVASTAGLCNLCSEPTSQLSKSKVKQCAHEMCKNRYCAPCIDKLIGKAQVRGEVAVLSRNLGV